MNRDSLCVISFASGVPYTYEVLHLQNLCRDNNINFLLYNMDWLKTKKIYSENKELFDSKKSGYCAWKPYIILETLKDYKNVLYLDSSVLFNPNYLDKFINSTKNILSTLTTLTCSDYTKRKTFEIMNAWSFTDCLQYWSGTISVKKTRDSINFLKEWLGYCLDKECISDEGKGLYSTFKYHLYDQSIYSILYNKYKYKNIENSFLVDGKVEAYFCDTRESGHRNYIEKRFGEKYVDDQDLLINQFSGVYVTNGSCCYNPQMRQKEKV